MGKFKSSLLSESFVNLLNGKKQKTLEDTKGVMKSM